MNKKPVIGLLGGIGSGKSTVASEFARLGLSVIDADKMAKRLLEDPMIKKEIEGVMGVDIYQEEDRIDPSKVAKKAFSASQILEKLNAIIHPRLLEQTERLVKQFLRDDRVSGVVLDMPLLVEVGWDRRCNVLIFVESELALRQARLEKKRGFSAKQIKKRENFQISLDKKKKIAQYIVKNNSDLSDLTEQVVRIYKAVVKSAGVD